MRKAAIVQTMANDPIPPEVASFFDTIGLGKNNLQASSLINCFKFEQDFFSLKKSILSLRSRGTSNKYTRDMCRTPFLPFARDDADLSDLLHSARQSSILDAIVMAKVNINFILPHLKNTSVLNFLFTEIDENLIPIDEICSLYISEDSDGEFNFYKHSSAWLENPAIVSYRSLLDNFYDSSDSDYLNITPDLIERVGQWVNYIELDELPSTERLTTHSFKNLHVIENLGSMTRSAIFNYKIHLSEGFDRISEKELFMLMDKTRDLAKTSNAKFLSNMAKLLPSNKSKIVLYFLIARKSKNELDNHMLRRILQAAVISDFNGELVSFFDDIASRSRAVAEFAYEVCSEDFIAKLFNIIHSTSEITETRAQLHKWMGQFSGEKIYFDRARTLLIDHQLNKVRDEIDDNRIYVDAARFSEWINDEVMRELNSVLMGMELKSSLLENDADPQLIKLIEHCYTTFCSNNIFGIASYLGRRIRHGTFKGHLFSSVLRIERAEKYRDLLSDFGVATHWDAWKIAYEEKVNLIIKDRLHIESSGKRNGLIKPNQVTAAKSEVFYSCARLLARDYAEKKSSHSAIPIIIDYCWRLAENDLRSVNSYLKSQKPNLINKDILQELRASATNGKFDVATDFNRELVRSIDEKLMAMYNWFKRPLNVSPKASLSLLYKAVVAEVKEIFPDINTNTDFEEHEDIELVGGAYHVLYDSLYVIIYNAAKHGKSGADISRYFTIVEGINSKKILVLNISSIVCDEETDEYVNSRLSINPDDDMTNAQVSEDRSGIRKLHHLVQCTPNFQINQIGCNSRKVIITMSYLLEH